MSFRAKVLNVDEVPEDVRDKLVVDGEDTFIDLDALSNAYSRNKADKAALADKLKQQEEQLAKYTGIDIAEYTTLKQKNEEWEAEKARLEEERQKLREEELRKAGEWQQLEEMRAEKARKEREELEAKAQQESNQLKDRLSTLEKQLEQRDYDVHQAKLSDELRSVYDSSEVANPHFIDHEVRRRIKVEKSANGGFETVILDKSGNPMSNGSFTDILKELKEDPKWKGAFAPSGMGGSGSSSKEQNGDVPAGAQVFSSQEWPSKLEELLADGVSIEEIKSRRKKGLYIIKE